MTTFAPDELEHAFLAYWQAGAVGEDWDAWADRFHAGRRTRLHWGDGPAWTRGARSWAARPGRR